MARFEYRYFNGEKWTSDVAVNGQRYVDSPIDQLTAPAVTPKRPRGKAIASFVTGVSGVAFGWVPFIFVLAAGAAVAAIVFGVLGLKTARQHGGHGRGFAVAGLVLAPVALAVCVGGFFFTKATVRELRDFVEPGPHDLVVEQPCTFDGNEATLRGTIQNLDDQTHDYRLLVDFDSTEGDTERVVVRVLDLRPDATARWSASATMTGSAVRCEVADVFGPYPFNIDEEV